MSCAVVPQTVLAYDVPIHASFVVAFSGTPNKDNVAYCGGTPGPVAIEAHGDGFSTLGALAFSLQKTQTIPPPPPALFHGCLTLTAPDGDTLTATYDAKGNGPPNSNNFSSATGTLTFTGGTGRFDGASGTATLTAVFDNFYPASAGTGPTQGMAFYVVQGKVSISGRRDD
jgi:hypothetical protein